MHPYDFRVMTQQLDKEVLSFPGDKSRGLQSREPSLKIQKFFCLMKQLAHGFGV